LGLAREKFCLISSNYNVNLCALGKIAMQPESKNNKYKLIWQIVQQIPKGKVATYGHIAELCGLKGQARLVGYALHNLPEKTKIPWHRVINAKAYKTLTSSRKKDQLYTAFYNYEDHSGTKVASIALNIPERNVIKTILLETDKKQPLIVLMHGDCEFSTKNLACLLGVKHIEPCD